MTEQIKIAGVVLAGGMARRMGHQDKGLVKFAGKALVDYAISSLRGITPHIAISANRHLEHYQRWGLPVIADSDGIFLGPLAGVYAALEYFDADVLLVMPCDSPFFGSRQFQQLISGLSDSVDVVIASDAKTLHPIFMVLKTRLKDSLKQFLTGEGRRVQDWVKQQRWVAVEFDDSLDIFANINTAEELLRLEGRVINS